MVHDTEKCVLKTGGAFLKVRKFPDRLYLCAVECQNEEKNAPIVYILRQEIGKVPQMAFCFKRGDDLYSLKVEGSILKVEKIVNNNIALTQSHWFEKRKVNGSLQYHLYSVAVPGKSLSLDDDNRFILSDDPNAPITERVVA